MADWTDQVAIVTGSSRGIGRAIARALAERGAAICINYATRTAEAEAAAAEIAATGGRVIAIQADVADADAVARMVARTEAELGPVSILVNNASVSSPATLESYDPAAMARMRRVNVDGVIHTIRAVAPGMQERGYGRIVNIASNVAIGTALPGEPPTSTSISGINAAKRSSKTSTTNRLRPARSGQECDLPPLAIGDP